MNSFDTWFALLAKSNPGLADEANKLTLSAGELKRLLRKSFNAGWDAHREAAKAVDRASEKAGPIDRLFDGIFNRKKGGGV